MSLISLISAISFPFWKEAWLMWLAGNLREIGRDWLEILLGPRTFVQLIPVCLFSPTNVVKLHRLVVKSALLLVFISLSKQYKHGCIGFWCTSVTKMPFCSAFFSTGPHQCWFKPRLKKTLHLKLISSPPMTPRSFQIIQNGAFFFFNLLTTEQVDSAWNGSSDGF